MAKTIYRICLVVCLITAIMAGLFLYRKYEDKGQDTGDWTLVFMKEGSNYHVSSK